MQGCNNMGDTAKLVAQRLSLRKPQKDSLELLEKLVKTIGIDFKDTRQSKLEKVSALQIQSFTDFDREFPSFAFGVATGVGKTRLMGAFISYLFLEHKLRDFLVLAPNLTIYNKLIEDFSNPSNPKYVFRGIGEFVHSPPKIITGDNYANVNTQRKVYQATVQQTFFGEEVAVNIFNISKINSETRGGNSPKIKRLSEYLGESYFQYLQNVDRLVLLMDEAHQYRAERGMAVINELKPILGLEFTATPVDRDGEPFNNIVYQYSLAKAIADGFVKDPAVATRKNMSQQKLDAMTDVELDRLKLEDAIRVHDNTKTKLLSYAKNNNLPVVKPFILVVARDTTHAKEVEDYIKSHEFFDARYANSVITIHSKLKGDEEDKNIELLLSVERADNPIEIVIHVNKLKEGWDVTNLYTIVPLRAFAAEILAEQTLGRGLRLPYGERTGDPDVDTLTVIAHDRFEELIQAAQNETSIIKKQTIIDIDDPAYSAKQEVRSISSNVEQELEDEEKAAQEIVSEEDRNQAVLAAKAKRLVLNQLRGSNEQQLSLQPDNVDSKETTQQVSDLVKQILPSDANGKVDENLLKKVTKEIVKDFLPGLVRQSISIPRIVIQPKENSIKAGFKQFSLNTKGLPKFNPIHDEILIKTLQEQKDKTIGVVNYQNLKDSNENLILAKLIDHDEIDYELHQDLLYSLVDEMLAYLRSIHKKEDDVTNIVLTQREQLADQIWAQMKDKFYCEVGEYEVPVVKPFTAIETHNYSTLKDLEPKDIRATVKTIAELRKTLFSDFKKACHSAYKFDSFGEHRFAQILESDGEKDVEKWLRPAPRQFHIYWDHHTKTYEPDFVVETKNAIWIAEIKASTEMDAPDTQEKAKAAMVYCKHATEDNKKSKGKPWRYTLIPDQEVRLNQSFKHLAENFEVTNA
jgi:type III restriction enzyme